MTGGPGPVCGVEPRRAEPVEVEGLVEAGQGGRDLDGDAGEVVPLGEGEPLHRHGAGALLVPPAQGLRVHAQRPGTQPRRGVGEQLDRLGSDRLGVLGGVGEEQGGGDGGEHLTAVGRGGVRRQRREVGAEDLDRLADPARGDEGLGAAAHEGVHVDVVGDLGQSLEQVERLEELHRRLVRPADREGLVAGLDAGPDRGEPVTGPARVQRELGRGAGRRTRPQRLAERGVQPGALAGQQVVVDRLAEERVPEGVGRAARLGEDVGLDGAAQRGLEVGGVQAGDRREQLVRHVSAGDAGDPDHLAGAVVEAVEAHQQHVGQLGGHVSAGGPRRPDQLLDEEGVALGPVDDLGDARLADRGVAVDQVDEEAHVGVAERLDLHALDSAQPRPLRDLRPQRVAPVQVVGAVGHDQPHRPREGSGEQEAQHVARRLVGPVRVLDDHEQRAALGHRLEQVVDGGEDVAAVEGLVLVAVVGGAEPSARLEAGEGGVTLGHARGHLRPLREDAPEDLGEGEVGQRPVGQVEAVAGQHQPALAERDVAQLGQQPGLADARVAGEEHGVRRGAARARECRAGR